MQNRWLSASVMVLPGQWRYSSPTSKSLEAAAEAPLTRLEDPAAAGR